MFEWLNALKYVPNSISQINVFRFFLQINGFYAFATKVFIIIIGPLRKKLGRLDDKTTICSSIS